MEFINLTVENIKEDTLEGPMGEYALSMAKEFLTKTKTYKRIWLEGNYKTFMMTWNSPTTSVADKGRAYLWFRIFADLYEAEHGEVFQAPLPLTVLMGEVRTQ